jgi:hypothetical protein
LTNAQQIDRSLNSNTIKKKEKKKGTSSLYITGARRHREQLLQEQAK